MTDDLQPVTSDPAGAARRFTFVKSQKLLTGAQFEAVFKARLSAGDGVLVLHGRANGLERARLGLAVSRKVGNAVRRNRWKRLLREAFRLAQHDLPPIDLVCVPRLRGEPTLRVLDASLRGLAGRVARKAARADGAPRLGEDSAPRPGEGPPA